MADPIWLQKLKKRFGQSLSSERITPKRPNFTGTPGYNTEMPEVPAPENWLRHGIDGVKIEGGLENLPPLDAEGSRLAYKGALVDPHLAAAAGGPGWGSGMAPSTMTKVPASASGGGFKRVLKHLAAMESPGPDWSLQAQNVGVRSPWSPTNQPWAAVGENMYGQKKKRYA